MHLAYPTTFAYLYNVHNNQNFSYQSQADTQVDTYTDKNHEC